MKAFKFNSQMEVLGHMPKFDQSIVKEEPMFFNSSIEYAYEHGGPITKAFLDSLPNKDIVDYVFDSRVHMLMEGFYPCIPGWHHDDVPRSTANGQPNYINPEYHSDHILGLVNGDICPTEFCIGEAEMPDVDEGEVYYRVWHERLEEFIKAGKLQVVQAANDPIIKFDAHSFHRGQQALKGGWRWFGRVSWNTDRCNNKTNEIRKQVQVYIPSPDHRGW